MIIFPTVEINAQFGNSLQIFFKTNVRCSIRVEKTNNKCFLISFLI